MYSRARTALLALTVLLGCSIAVGGAYGLTVTDQVKINEVRIDATETNENLGEFVELYNAGLTTVYLDGAILTEEPVAGGEGVWKFPGTVGGTTIPMVPGQFILIVPISTGHTYAGLADFEARGSGVDNPAVPDLANLNGTAVMALANAGDDLHLYTGNTPGPFGLPCGECVDGVTWGTGGDLGAISSTVCTDPLPATIGASNDSTTIGRCLDGNDTNVNSKNDFWKMPKPGTPKVANLPVCISPAPVFVVERRDPCVPIVLQSATVEIRARYATGADISYKVNGGSTTQAPMALTGTSGDTTTYSYVLPPQSTNGDLVEYFCRVFNANPDTTQGYDQGYFVGTMAINDLYVNDGLGRNVYYKYGVRVTGVVTVPYGVFQTVNTDYYIQDDTGGINIFKYGTHTVQPALGDDITVEGALDQFNGKLEVAKGGPCDTLLVDINGAGTVPTPRLTTSCDDFEAIESELAKMMILKLPAGTDTLRANSNYKVTNCHADTVNLFIDVDAGIAPLDVIGYSYITVTGIASQYDGSSPYTAGYEIVPRFVSDIELLTSTGIDERNVRPVAQLLQNAPNPFGRSTEIRYQVPAGAKVDDLVPVKINVFDIRGRLVKTLVDGLQTSGAHVVALNSDALRNAGSGIYFYRLETGGQVLTRRLLYLEQ